MPPQPRRPVRTSTRTPAIEALEERSLLSGVEAASAFAAPVAVSLPDGLPPGLQPSEVGSRVSGSGLSHSRGGSGSGLVSLAASSPSDEILVPWSTQALTETGGVRQGTDPAQAASLKQDTGHQAGGSWSPRASTDGGSDPSTTRTQADRGQAGWDPGQTSSDRAGGPPTWSTASTAQTQVADDHQRTGFGQTSSGQDGPSLSSTTTDGGSTASTGDGGSNGPAAPPVAVVAAHGSDESQTATGRNSGDIGGPASPVAVCPPPVVVANPGAVGWQQGAGETGGSPPSSAADGGASLSGPLAFVGGYHHGPDGSQSPAGFVWPLSGPAVDVATHDPAPIGQESQAPGSTGLVVVTLPAPGIVIVPGVSGATGRMVPLLVASPALAPDSSPTSRADGGRFGLEMSLAQAAEGARSSLLAGKGSPFAPSNVADLMPREGQEPPPGAPTGRDMIVTALARSGGAPASAYANVNVNPGELHELPIGRSANPGPTGLTTSTASPSTAGSGVSAPGSVTENAGNIVAAAGGNRGAAAAVALALEHGAWGPTGPVVASAGAGHHAGAASAQAVTPSTGRWAGAGAGLAVARYSAAGARAVAGSEPGVSSKSAPAEGSPRVGSVQSLKESDESAVAGDAAALAAALPPAGELIASFSPFERGSLERAINQFLSRLDGLDAGIPGFVDAPGLVPNVLAAAAALSVVETLRRRLRRVCGDDAEDAHDGGSGEDDLTFPGLPGGPGRWALEEP